MKATVLTIYILLLISADLGMLAARLERVAAQENKTRPRRVTPPKPTPRPPAPRKPVAKTTTGRAKNITGNRASDTPRKPVAKPTARPARQVTSNRASRTPRNPVAKPTARRVAPEIEMVLVHGGSFMMGSPDNETGHSDKEKPRHHVTVQAFYLGKYEVTQAQWRAVMGDNPSHFKGDDLPVENV